MRRLSIGLLLGILAGSLLALAVAIGVLNGAMTLRIVERRAEQSARQIAQTAAASLESYLDDSEASLQYLATRDGGAERDQEECQQRMADAGRLTSEFFQVARFDAAGELVCASTPISDELRPTLANEPWFSAVRRGDTLVVGPPTRVPEIDVWVSPLAYPVRSEDGAFRGAMVGTVDLTRLQRLLSAVRLPEKGLITVSRVGDAVVVARTENAEEWVGRRITGADLDAEQMRRGGVNRTEGMDGVARIWGYAPVPAADWVVFAGFPVSWTRGPAWRVILATGLLTLLLLAVATFLVVRVRRIIVGSVRELVHASRSAARGEVDQVSVRGPPEIQELAGAFNRTLEDRETLDRRLREAEKTEALARLAGGVAHDFRNLLTVVTGEASLALSELEEEHPARESLETIEDTAKRAAEVTRKLLAFSQQAPEDVEDMDLNARVQEEARLLSVALGGEHSIRTELASDLPAVRCGERRIQVILRELVENAVHALPEGGVVEIRTGAPEPSRDGAGDGEGGPRPEHSDAGAYLEIRDRGTGMTSRVRERIFEPFYSTRPRERGTGLGMPMVQGLVKQIGGRVSVESTPGRGTRVRVHFQAAEPKTDAGS